MSRRQLRRLLTSLLVREKGRQDGASNGTYYAAYVYFEKVRILENKKKSAKRLEVESMFPDGLLRENHRYVWGPF